MLEEPSRAVPSSGSPVDGDSIPLILLTGNPSIHVVRSATTLGSFGNHLQALIVRLLIALRELQIRGIQQEDG
jgi:hypothetical protein